MYPSALGNASTARPSILPSAVGTRRITGAKRCTAKFGYPANSSSAPSPPSATVISRRAARQTSQVGKSDASAERFAEPLADGVKGIDEIGLAELDDLVAHPEMARDPYGVGCLVKAVVEPLAADPWPPTRTVNAVRSGAASAASAVTRLEIDTARQKNPDRHIGDDLMPHRLAQQLVEPLDRLVPVDGPIVEARLPIALAADPPVIDGQDRAGFELFDPAPSRSGSRQILKEQQSIGGLPVGCRVAKERVAEECRHLGGEDEPAARGPPVERLFAEPVAHQVEGAAGAVAKGKGEHAVDAPGGAVHPVAADHLEQDFGIRAVAQRDPGTAQLVGERAVAVDLAVEDEGVAGRFVDPRLSPAREIDDRQAGMAECDAAVDKDPAAVRPAMRQCPVHQRRAPLRPPGRVR